MTDREFREDVLKRYSEGKLSRQDTKQLMDKSFRRQTDIRNKSIKGGVNTIRSWVDDNVVDESIRARIKRDMIQEFSDRADAEKMDEREIQNVLDQVLNNQKREMNPRSGQYKLGEVINIRGVDVRVVGFDTDGEPLIQRLGPENNDAESNESNTESR